MNSELNKPGIHTLLWKRIAIIAGVFSFIICVLLIGNYLQLNKLDPVNTEAINTLVERLNKDPGDETLREEIRALDLLVRKAYFTNQWQIRTGGYLLLIGVAVIIIALQVLSYFRRINPEVSEDKAVSYLFIQKKTRKWITFGGAVIIITALVFAFLSHNELSDKFINAKIAATESENSIDVDNYTQDIQAIEKETEVATQIT